MEGGTREGGRELAVAEGERRAVIVHSRRTDTVGLLAFKVEVVV